MINERKAYSRRATIEHESRREQELGRKQPVKRCRICGGRVSAINICAACGTKAE